MSEVLDDKVIANMLQEATRVRENAYAPYSKFYVGASILSEDGRIFSGCNVENASYSLALCAESGAISALIASGNKKIKAILVVGSGKKLITPCGACRQRIREFAPPETPVYLADENEVRKKVTLVDLLPLSFGPEHL